MGLFSAIKSMINTRKFNKLTKEDLVNNVIELERQAENSTNAIEEKSMEIEEFRKKGRETKNKDMRLVYVKKINLLKQQIAREQKRVKFIMYNIDAMGKLQDNVESNTFFKDKDKNCINQLLADQVALTKFLNKALITKMKAENTLKSAQDTFDFVEMQYDEDQDIYGVNNEDDKELALMEANDSAEDFEHFSEVEQEGEIARMKQTLTEGE